MSHEIQNFDMHWGTESAWHKLNQIKKPAEMLVFENGPLDYVCKEENLFRANGQVSEVGKLIVAQRTRGTEIIESQLAVMSKSYETIQNSTVWEALMNSINGVPGHISYIGSVRAGAQTFITFEPDRNAWSASNGDKYRSKLVLTNSHNGSLALEAALSHVRVVCANTLAAHLASKNRISKIYHTKAATKQIEGFELAIAGLFESQRIFNKQLEELGNRKVSEAQAKSFILGTIGDVNADKVSTRTLNTYNEILNLFYKGKGNKGENAQDLLNAFTEYYTHGSSNSKRDSIGIFTSSEFGQYSTIKQNVFGSILNFPAYTDTMKAGQKVLANV